MSNANPYHAPETKAGSTVPSPSLLLWSGVTVVGSTVVGGAMGLGVGAAMGTTLPEYYRSVFTNGSDPGFNPVAVGIGQGLTQGIVFGGFIGLALVALFYWYRSRKNAA